MGSRLRSCRHSYTNVVEKKLQREESKTRHDLGREAFLDEVWKWHGEYSSSILHQLRKLGASLDWEREYFTLDETRSDAVTEAFVRLHQDGMIYRGSRIVHWCPILQTALSDVEVEHVEIPSRQKLAIPSSDSPIEFGVMHRIGYRVYDTDVVLHVDTTRPETILGDTAIAVHPEDARYAHLIGKCVVHPFRSMIPFP